MVEITVAQSIVRHHVLQLFLHLAKVKVLLISLKIHVLRGDIIFGAEKCLKEFRGRQSMFGTSNFGTN